eukprot:5300986-Amphidinium_carterae.1
MEAHVSRHKAANANMTTLTHGVTCSVPHSQMRLRQDKATLRRPSHNWQQLACLSKKVSNHIQRTHSAPWGRCQSRPSGNRSVCA